MNDMDIFEEMGVKVETTEETNKKISTACKEIGMQTFEIKEDNKQHEIFYGLQDCDREQAVIESIVPRVYKNSRFDTEKIKDNLIEQNKRNKGLYKIFKFPDYIETCNGILSAIRMKKLPNKSYLIGAPNGFGKSSFVFECLITLRRQGFKVVPYISLLELANLRVENEKRLMNPYSKYKEENGNYYYTEPNKQISYLKEPEIITGRYSYSEYINADCLFVSFTDVMNKDIESHTLYQLLNIRGPKGLPTIAMISTSLEPYLNDLKLKEQVWDEIKAYSEKDNCYDRVYHVSCYKKKKIDLDTKGNTIDSDTGIVH